MPRGSATKRNDTEKEREREREREREVHKTRIRGSPRVLLHARPMGVGAGDDGPRRGGGRQQATRARDLLSVS